MNMKRLYLDMEFTGLHQKTSLISVALVSTTGCFFYGECTDYNRNHIDDWIQKNVIENTVGLRKSSIVIQQIMECGGGIGKYVLGTREYVAEKMVLWMNKIRGNEAGFEIWSDVLAYDWVLFCELFGGARNIPDWLYYIPFDIASVMKWEGIDPDISREELAGEKELEFYKGYIEELTRKEVPNAKHNALWDAYVIRGCYLALDRMRKSKPTMDIKADGEKVGTCTGLAHADTEKSQETVIT